MDVERDSLKRSPEQVSAVVGYAGGRQAGPGGRICYYYGPGDRSLCHVPAQQGLLQSCDLGAGLPPVVRVSLGWPRGLVAMQATQCTRNWGTRR